MNCIVAILISYYSTIDLQNIIYVYIIDNNFRSTGICKKNED
jgi:hypothetical protein